MYKGCDESVRQEMEDAARLENERIAAGPTKMDIIRYTLCTRSRVA
jgi:hypothetical protein